MFIALDLSGETSGGGGQPSPILRQMRRKTMRRCPSASLSDHTGYFCNSVQIAVMYSCALAEQVGRK